MGDLYAERVAAFRTWRSSAARQARRPMRVAEVVEEALTAERPHTRYLVGRDASCGPDSSASPTGSETGSTNECSSRLGGAVGYTKGSIDEMGGGPGFRKIRRALGRDGVRRQRLVYPPDQEGFLHYHDKQDELYFVHRGRARSRSTARRSSSGRAGVVHVESTTPRKISNTRRRGPRRCSQSAARTGYVGRDGQLVDVDRDLPRRQAFTSAGK